jgi:hypothetical protein
MGFLVFLVRRGALHPAQAIELAEHQFRERPRLGDMAVERGLLTADQVTFVTRLQAKDPRRFGEMCVKLGFLDARGVEELADAQERSTPHVQSLLLALDLVEPTRLQALWKDYVLEER